MSNDEPNNTVSRNLIFHAQQRVQRARERMWREYTTNGNVYEDTRQQLQAAVLAYYDVLHNHRDHTAIKDDWTDIGPWENGLEDLPKYAMTPESREEQPAGRRGASPTEEHTARRIPPKVLYDISHGLDDIAKELGLSAQTRDKTPHDEGDLGDLEALLRARGQDAAADRIATPGGN